jgi:amidase
MGIREIQAKFRDKSLSVRELAADCITRIAEIDSCPDGLNAVLELNPDALNQAAALDEQLKGIYTDSELFGIPILLKDNINTGDRLRTSAGSLALADNYAGEDAPLVARLREAGAVILGKANMTEFANFMCDGKMPSGYSSRGGQVINPHVRTETPSGSSSGSAVAVAAGLCAAAIGTETCGSIISPAQHCGIVGIKPTKGLVDGAGIIPISYTLDTAGPMTRSVEDAAIMLNAMSVCGNEYDYTRHLNPDGLKGARIAVYQERNEENPAYENLLKILTDAGAIVIDVELGNEYNIGDLMKCEFKACINHYLSTARSSMKSLNDIILYNQAHAARALKYGQDLLLYCQNETTGNMTEPRYINALLERERAIARLDAVFDESGADVILCDCYRTAPFTGFPSMTVPIGKREDGLPYGSYWIARRFDEAALIRVCGAVEAAVGCQ